MQIDNLSVGLKVNGADKAVQRIMDMAKAVESLARGVSAIDAGRLESFANGLKAVKGSAPTEKQATNMTAFAAAITEFTNAISGANITQVATDMSNLSSAVQGMGARSVRTLTNATSAMQNFAQQTRQAVQNANVAPNRGGNGQANANARDLTLAYQQVNRELNRTAIAADSLGGRLQRIGAIVPTNRFRSLNEQLQNVRRRYDELRQTMNQALQSGQTTPDSREYQRWSRNLEGLRNEYDRLIERQRALALEGNGFKISPTLQAGLEGFKKGFNGVINVAKNGFVSAISSANKHLSSFVKNLTGANSAQKALQKTMNSMKALPDKIAKGLTRLGKMLKLMVTRMALRAVIKEVGNGFQSLALHSDQFNESMSNVINASKQLGYSFSAMVSPLINALAPAIVYIINLLTQLLNIINQVFSSLSGATTWNKAKNFTDSWRDSIEDANASAGKLKKTVLGFDELNQLQEKTTGSKSGKNITDMFETMQIDPRWKEFAEWLKKMWGDKDFTELGTKLGEKLKKALDSIPWDKIRQTSNDLGKALATLINGFVEVQGLAYSIGTTVAQGVNTVFEFINGFVHNLHWDSIGKFIAELFNGFFEKIDWKLIKDTVVTGLKGIADSLNSFVENFHWDNISNFVINGIDTIVSGIRTFFETVKWGDIGKNLGEQLQKSIKGINWRDIGIALGDILQAVIDFVSNFVKQLKVEDIRAALKAMVDGFFDTVDTEELGHTLADIIDLVIQVAAGFWRDNKDRLWEEGKKLVKGIFEGLDDETKSDIKDIVGTVIEVAVLAGVTKAAIGIVGSAVVTGFKNKIISALFGTTGTGAGVTGGVVSEAGEIGAQTAATFGSRLASGISAALLPVGVTVAAGYALASAASKELEPIIEENQKLVDAMKGSMDSTIPTYDEMSRAAREASHNTKEYAEKMQSMYDAVLNAHPELKTLDDALKENKVNIKNNVDTLVQINDGLKIFRENGYNATDTLEELESMYGSVDKKAQDFFYDLSVGKSNVTEVSTAMFEYNESLKENETQEDNLIKVYKNHTEYVEDMRKAHENVVGSFKTHWDVINQNKDATNDLTNSVKDAAKTMPSLDSALKDSQKAMSDTSKEAETTGENIVKGIKEPIINAKFDTESKGLFDTVISNIKRAFGIASPAKNMYPIGNEILNGIVEGFKEKYGNFKSSIENFYNNTVKPWFDPSKWKFDGVGKGLQQTFEEAKNLIKSPINSIIGFMEKLVNSIIDGFNKMGDVLGSIDIDIPDWVPEIGGRSFEFSMPTLSHISIPKLKNGGMLEDGMFFTANHNELIGGFDNGKTAVANNTMIVEGIQNGVYNAVMSALSQQGGSERYISNEIYIDGEKIASSVTKAQEKQNRRYSPSMA